LVGFITFVETLKMKASSQKMCVVKCALLNNLFSQEFADNHFNGEESEDNPRFQWEDEFRIKGVHKMETKEAWVYELTGIHPSKGTFYFPISNMRVIHLFHNDKEPTQIAISEILMDSFSLSETSEELLVSIELKDNEPFINPIAGVYIANCHIPSELKNA
jgi:hypothetical protein